MKKSWRDLSKRKARTIFTILTIAMGVMGVGLFAVTPLADRSMEEEIENENMHNIAMWVTDVNLTDDQVTELEEIDNVKEVEVKALYYTKMYIGHRRNWALFVGIRDFDNQHVDKMVLRSGHTPGDWEVLTEVGNSNNGVYYGKNGDSFQAADHTGELRNFTITGEGKNFLSSSETIDQVAVFYTTVETVRTMANFSGYNSLRFTVEDSDSKAMEETTEDIRSYLSENTDVVAFGDLPDYREEGQWEGRETFEQLMSFMTLLTVIILFCSVFLISNTMNTIIAEQRTVIAQLKAIGATRLQVFRSFLITSAIMGIIGAILGALLGIFVSHFVLISMAEPFGLDPGFSVHLTTVFLSFVLGVGVVILASLPALYRSTKVTVREGMESHGISTQFGEGTIEKYLMRIKGLPRTIQMGIRNAVRTKGRSAATVFQVALAVGLVLSMLVLGASINKITEETWKDRTWDLMAFPQGVVPYAMTADNATLFTDIDGVRSAEPMRNADCEFNGRTMAIWGRTHNTTTYVRHVNKGRWWTEQEELERTSVIVVGSGIAAFEDIKVGDEVSLMTATGKHSFSVIGIDKTVLDDGRVFHAPWTTLNKVLGKENNTVSGFYLKTDSKDHGEIDRTTEQIYKELEKEGFHLEIMVQYVMVQEEVEQNDALGGLFLTVSFIIVFISLIGLMNTLTMNVLDRTKEIGMLRCIGAKAKDIKAVFSSEGVFLAILGWIIGVPIGYALTQYIYAWVDDAMKITLPEMFPLEFVFWSFLFTIIGTVVVILAPVTRAARFKPGDALRYE